jgi:hypothetical protein
MELDQLVAVALCPYFQEMVGVVEAIPVRPSAKLEESLVESNLMREL